MLMENFLRSKEYQNLVEKGIEQPAPVTTLTEAKQKKIEESKLKDLKTKNYLFQAIDRATLETILVKDTAKDIWESMKKKRQGNARVKRSTVNDLRKDFESLEMKSGETITKYVARVMTVANKMRIDRGKLEDVIIVEKILISLTEKFLHVVCSIEESSDTDKMSVNEIQSSLVVHEQKILKVSKNHGEEQALKVATPEKGESWSRTRGRGGSTRRRGRQPPRDN